MTVIPGREQSVIKAIMSIRNGERKPDAMYINIPNKYVRFKEPLAGWLKPVLETLGMTIINLDSDWCCLNKILPILTIEKDPNTLVVTIDDDIIYKPLFISGLLAGYEKFGGVVGYSGLLYPENAKKHNLDPLHYNVRVGHGSPTEILQQGFGTMTKLSSFYDFPNIPALPAEGDPTFYLSDDYVISRFYDFKNLPKTVVCWDQIGRFKDDWSSVCTLLDEDTGPKLSTDRRSLEDYLRASEMIKQILNWPYRQIE